MAQVSVVMCSLICKIQAKEVVANLRHFTAYSIIIAEYLICMKN
jgi:hypothetical protein